MNETRDVIIFFAITLQPLMSGHARSTPSLCEISAARLKLVSTRAEEPEERKGGKKLHPGMEAKPGCEQ
jgi:hypothetical protein